MATSHQKNFAISPESRASLFHYHRFTICHTCLQWREIARSATVLWHEIVVTCSPSVALPLELLELELCQAHDMPLDLTVFSPINPRLVQNPIWELYLDVLSPALSRCETLNIVMSYNDVIDSLLKTIIPPTTVLPKLKCLQLDTQDSNNASPLNISWFPHLKHLRLCNLWSRIHFSISSSITILDLNIPFEDGIGIISKCPQLEFCMSYLSPANIQ